MQKVVAGLSVNKFLKQYLSTYPQLKPKESAPANPARESEPLLCIRGAIVYIKEGT